MQSGYHNLPTIAGCDQLPGPEFKATNITVSDDKTSITMDIKEAYPSECQLHSYKRYASLTESVQNIKADSNSASNSSSDSQHNLTIKDKWIFEENTTNKEIILNFMTYEKPEVILSESSDEGGLFKIGDLCTFEFHGANKFKIETIPVTDDRLKKTWKHELYRVRFYPAAGASEFTLTATPYPRCF